MKRIGVFFGILFILSTSSFATSIDCEKNNSLTELLICNDEDILALDKELATTYTSVLARAKNPIEQKNAQIYWISKVRNKCGISKKCLIDVYEKRIVKLNNIWEARQAELDKIASRNASIPGKPFEGEWRSCSLVRGQEICISNFYVQQGVNVCGEWNTWATYVTYSGRLQAITKNPNEAEVRYICGTPGYDVSTECQDEHEPNGGWEKSKRRLVIENNRMEKYYLRFPLNDKFRGNLISQPWVKECLAGVKPVNLHSVKR